MEIKSFIRKTITIDISINNPLNIPIILDVNIQGEGLQGESYLKIQPKSASNYELKFTPLRIFNNKG